MSMAEKGHAQNNVRDGLRDIMRQTKPRVTVTQVINGNTIVVNNNETIHLPAIYIPLDPKDVAGEAMLAAKNYLEEKILDKFVSIYQVRDQVRGQTNALGHTEGYIVTEDGQTLIQAEMVRQGLAFAYPTQSHFEIAPRLYKAEQEARDNKVGLWGEDKWAVLTDREAKTAPMDQFAIVEGEIVKVASRNNIIYLNFERDWREDFTIAVDSSIRRDFAKYGHNIMQLGNTPVRVRGWMRNYNGPFIEIFHPSQLEILDELSAKQDNEAQPSNEQKEFIEDTIKERVLPNSPMFANPTLEDLTTKEERENP